MANKHMGPATQIGPTRLNQSPKAEVKFTPGVPTEVSAATQDQTQEQEQEYSQERATGQNKNSDRADTRGAATNVAGRDPERVAAEEFLRDLPEDCPGVLITSRGAKIISSKTELRDSITLVELYKADLIAQAQRMAAFLSEMALRLAEDRAEKDEE